mmetsp:Transcript_50097/g.93736  ORF Transcript_50097/g.93736 Transcript_50097/m.93736 type:complete len:158 (-) Transcript_50097:121-594(-)
MVRVKSKFRVPPRRKTHGRKMKTLYHISEYGKEIKTSGEMIRGSTGAVGGGIYFARSRAECEAKSTSDGYVIQARVLTGKAKKVRASKLKDYTFTKLYKKGYDSIKLVGFSSGTEYVVFNKDQVELCKVEKGQDSSTSSSSSSTSSSSASSSSISSS